MKSLCLAATLVAFVVAQQPSAPVSAQPASPNSQNPAVKQQNGANAAYYGNPSPISGNIYNPQPVTGNIYNPQPIPGYFPQQPQPTNQHVCDFDAAILVVLTGPNTVNNGYGNQGGNQQGGYYGQQGGYGQQPESNWWQTQSQGQRIKCSDVAVLDDESCKTCCRLSARRRDSNVRNEDIDGILVDKTQLDVEPEDATTTGTINGNSYNPNTNFPGYPGRYKRNTSANPPGTVHGSISSRFNPNIRCMCCAPRQVVAPVFPQQPIPGYLQQPAVNYPQPQPQYGR
ncbi:hypothetical protein QR680_003189 [Steinernema hermaphroditum]|uniref:Uncharacterized protein n=1 Tax=Steinernema hermaphroditum TaxID=289476 RepID=A0AA39LJL8_9BILA|nr:hypothetical protein QR680_003189 [Steinernema hermaphroditum]